MTPCGPSLQYIAQSVCVRCLNRTSILFIISEQPCQNTLELKRSFKWATEQCRRRGKSNSWQCRLTKGNLWSTCLIVQIPKNLQVSDLHNKLSKTNAFCLVFHRIPNCIFPTMCNPIPFLESVSQIIRRSKKTLYFLHFDFLILKMFQVSDSYDSQLD